jgi:hypothetical protein
MLPPGTWLRRPPLFAFALALAAAPLSAAPDPAPADAVPRAFERFQSLAGSWVGTSTKGWTETIDFRVIAQGSAVMETSFDAHPDETMVTMIHPDGERLLLTHYCVAKNQPRLVMTTAAPDLSEIVFEFLDGTNLPTRDKGHMDKVVFRFAGPEGFTSQWTWYQDGKESWMEEIRYARADEGEGAP